MDVCFILENYRGEVLRQEAVVALQSVVEVEALHIECHSLFVHRRLYLRKKPLQERLKPYRKVWRCFVYAQYRENLGKQRKTRHIFPFLFRGVLALGVIEVPWANPKFRQALFVTDLVLVAVGNHLGDLFLCHHGF